MMSKIVFRETEKMKESIEKRRTNQQDIRKKEHEHGGRKDEVVWRSATHKSKSGGDQFAPFSGRNAWISKIDAA